ncbi:MAG: squalene--hopene cyclase, partial [Mariprofundaceae bacterium]|nr:squalene--hopene cyclase [Mariprofundaceae bacterium]
EGCWSFELEADCTITAEYILMMHFMDEVDATLQGRMARYLRALQNPDGGWPLYANGKNDISCSVKTYYALKLAGDDMHMPHMCKARQCILDAGGAARCNVFTRIELAKFGQIPWRGVPFMPVELMLLPGWVPFHVNKISYWSRTVMVPLLILCSLRVKAANPSAVHVGELFVGDPWQEKDYFPVRSTMNKLFLQFERCMRLFEPLIPRRLRQQALNRAEQWMLERLNGTGGLGAIFPAMINAYEALKYLGYDEKHPRRQQAKQALQDLLQHHQDSSYCQPCNSPVWDTAIVCLALGNNSDKKTQQALQKGLAWLQQKQLEDEPGDWRDTHPDLHGGGWPFQHQNSHYPDVDDTAMVVWSMLQNGQGRYDNNIRTAMNWIKGMQSKNGGFASFDADNTCFYLNHIPFADHGALLDPPSSDVSGRALIGLAALQENDKKNDGSYRVSLQLCLDYLRNEQEENGAWFGRWGSNYIYGTWSVLTGLVRAGIDTGDPMIQRASVWLKSMQHIDGGWGESNDTYELPQLAGSGQSSTTFQTAWAVLALMAAGGQQSREVRRGIQYLLAKQGKNGLWQDDVFTAPGFPRVFYLKYHGYDKYFPLWALAQFREHQHAVLK